MYMTKKRLSKQEYHTEYDKRRRTGKRFSTSHLPGFRETNDVYGIQRIRPCFEYNKLMIAFLTQNYNILK